MVSVLHTNLISCRVSFALSCFNKRNFSYSGFIVARTIQSRNSIDLPDPIGKTPITSWPLKRFKIKRWKVFVTQGKSDSAKH